MNHREHKIRLINGLVLGLESGDRRTSYNKLERSPSRPLWWIPH